MMQRKKQKRKRPKDEDHKFKSNGGKRDASKTGIDYTRRGGMGERGKEGGREGGRVVFLGRVCTR